MLLSRLRVGKISNSQALSLTPPYPRYSHFSSSYSCLFCRPSLSFLQPRPTASGREWVFQRDRIVLLAAVQRLYLLRGDWTYKLSTWSFSNTAPEAVCSGYFSAVGIADGFVKTCQWHLLCWGWLSRVSSVTDPVTACVLFRLIRVD